MYILYILIALIIIFIIASTIVRRQIYKEVDRLEDWKNSILNRPIPDEIARVKQLRMSGETEEKFERWRTIWDDIVGATIPHIGESLFDIEDLVAKYRFKKAKQLVMETDERLKSIEEQLATMTKEIQHLVESAKQNETEIDQVRETFNQLRLELTKKRGLLGEGVRSFDERIEQMDMLLKQFDEETEKGSYLQARENLLQVSDLIRETETLLERYPQLLVTLETTIPNELQTFQEGVKEMEEEGYILDSFDLPTRVKYIEDELKPLKDQLIALACDDVEKRLNELSEEIEQLYDILENEVVSHQYIVTEIPNLKDAIQQLNTQIDELLEETTDVKESYHIPKEKQAEQEKMKDTILDLTRQLTVIEEGATKKAQPFTSLREMVEDWQGQLATLIENVQAEKDSLYKLREEEWQAKETIQQLKQRLLETRRLIQKSNVLGLPEATISGLEACEQKLLAATKQLEEVPLELGRVVVLVAEAKEAVDQNVKQVEDTIETAHLAERVIQFGNRFRSRSESVHNGLLEAEQLFRQCEYEEALQYAVEVIRPFEPNVLELVKEYERQVL